MITSRTKVGHPARVFRYDSADEQKMMVQFARICVLYDDLMLEYAGAEADEIKALDGSGFDARRFYFVRRQLGTIAELRQAIGALNKNTVFQKRTAAWSTRDLKQWQQAVVFFDTNHDFLKNWRDDVGGHFSIGRRRSPSTTLTRTPWGQSSSIGAATAPTSA
jgi:hypothetical protein